MGRRAHVPDPSQRRQVEALAAYGAEHRDRAGEVRHRGGVASTLRPRLTGVGGICPRVP